MMNELQTTRTLDVVAAEIRAFTASMLSNVIEIGRRMVEAKEMLPHGEFGRWIKEETGYSASTANNFMRLFQEYGAAQGSLFGAEVNCQTFGVLSYTKALALLAIPPEEREDFVIENHVEAMSTRELEALIKQKDEALQKAEQALKDQLEEQQSVYDTDMAELQGKLEEAEQATTKALEAAAKAKKELADLQARPVEVAVQEADPAELEKARKEGEAAAKKKLDAANTALSKANAEAEKLRKKLEQAQKDVKAAHEEAEEAKAQAKAAREQAERQSKESKAMADDDTAEFKLYFEQAQGMVNRMDGLLKKMAVNGREDQAAKLRMALKALANAVSTVAEG